MFKWYNEKKQVEEGKIERLLRAAMAVPSAGNQQPWEFYVVTVGEQLKALSECSPYAGMLKEAPLGIAPFEDRMKAVGKVMGISEDLYVFSIIACGYPAEEKVQQDRYDETRVHYVE